MVGTVVATIKDGALEGKKILIIQPIDSTGGLKGSTLVALDSVGAGVGENVYYTRGKEASFPWFPEEVPVDCSIVGILDSYNFDRFGLTDR